MCGRFSVTSSKEKLEKKFKAKFKSDKEFPLFDNAFPSYYLPVITQNSPNEIKLYRWGLIPKWAKDVKIGNRLINARAETILEKPSYKEPFKNSRCLVLADGFYEWHEQSGKKKIAYKINKIDNEPFAFAGVCDTWKDAEQYPINTFSIITTNSNDTIGKIHDEAPRAKPVVSSSSLRIAVHDSLSPMGRAHGPLAKNRMPVIIDEDDYENYLSNPDYNSLMNLLKPAPNNELKIAKVSS